MGKIRRARQKFHISKVTNGNSTDNTYNTLTGKDSKPIKLQEFKEVPLSHEDNIFSGVKIDLSTLSSKLSDDTKSVRSFKSVKSELGIKHQVSKKDKLKLRKEVLLKKIDTLQHMKQESKKRKKRKSVAIIGDTNQLHDALPDLESLLKSSETSTANTESKKGKTKGICKAAKRKKDLLSNINKFKTLMKDKEFKKNPLKILSLHLDARMKQL